MASLNELIDTINSSLDDAIGKFNDNLDPVQKAVYEQILVLTKDLDLSGGKLKRTVKNIRAIGKLKKAIKGIILDDKYLNKVAHFAKAFDSVTQLQNQYFSKLITDFSPPKVIDAIRQDAVNSTVELLTESGLDANVGKGVEDILRTQLRSGGSYADLTDQLKTFLTGKDGAFVKYAKTITVDSINTYAATVNDAISNDLGLQWFSFNGSMMTTSRPMCLEMHKRKYFHLSEIPDLIKGKVDGKQTPLAKSTGMPLGMKEETTVDNYMQLRNGWQCGHQFNMTTESQVPKDIVLEVKATPEYSAWKLSR